MKAVKDVKVRIAVKIAHIDMINNRLYIRERCECFRVSERITHRKMPSEIAAKVRMQDGPFPFAAFLRVIGFHAGIEANQEEIEIEAEA